MAAHINGSCTGVPGSVPVACGPRPSDDRSPAINAVTTFGCGAAVALGVTTASAVGEAPEFGVDSVAAVDTTDDVTCTGGSAEILGAGTLLRAGAEADDVEAAGELTAGGCAVLVAVEPVVTPLREDRRAPFVDVLPVDLGFPELADPVGGSPPVDDGEPVVVVDPDPELVDPPAPGSFPGGSDAVGEPLEGDVPVVDPVSGDSVWVVVPDPESPEPVVSAKATVGAEAIATPAPSATASAPTRPI